MTAPYNRMPHEEMMSLLACHRRKDRPNRYLIPLILDGHHMLIECGYTETQSRCVYFHDTSHLNSPRYEVHHLEEIIARFFGDHKLLRAFTTIPGRHIPEQKYHTECGLLVQLIAEQLFKSDYVHEHPDQLRQAFFEEDGTERVQYDIMIPDAAERFSAELEGIIAAEQADKISINSVQWQKGKLRCTRKASRG